MCTNCNNKIYCITFVSVVGIYITAKYILCMYIYIVCACVCQDIITQAHFCQGLFILIFFFINRDRLKYKFKFWLCPSNSSTIYSSPKLELLKSYQQ